MKKKTTKRNIIHVTILTTHQVVMAFVNSKKLVTLPNGTTNVNAMDRIREATGLTSFCMAYVGDKKAAVVLVEEIKSGVDGWADAEKRLEANVASYNGR